VEQEPDVGIQRASTGAGSVEALVAAERTRALFARNGVAQATVVLNSSVAVVVLWGHAPAGALVAWAGTLWLVAAARLALGAAYRRADPRPDQAERWARRFTLGAAVNGVAWGAAPLLVGAGLPLSHLIFLAFLLGGMAAGAALSSASRQAAFLAFTGPALAPMLLLLLLGGDRIRVGMGLLLAVFAAAVTRLSRTGGRAHAEAVRLRYANAELAAGLAALNAALEARVAERTAELEAARDRERLAERQLAAAARLATVGTLAAGVAHEVNNPLTYVGSNLAYVREELGRLGDDPAARPALEEALADAGDGVERVRRIMRHLMVLARLERPGELQPVDLGAVLDACADMARPELRDRARLVRVDGPIPAVLGDQARLVQIFLNLLLNAAQAIPPGAPGRHEVRLSTRAGPDGRWVVAEVGDTGAGIPAAIRDRIWEPFFTTRHAERGLGLGLAVCRSLAAELGGRIAVESREGAGTTFSVWLQAAAAAEAASPRD
jgi:signal transduction histidine kinase